MFKQLNEGVGEGSIPSRVFTLSFVVAIAVGAYYFAAAILMWLIPVAVVVAVIVFFFWQRSTRRSAHPWE